MIDTAQVYRNEEGVGNALKKSSVQRSDFFIVSKIWISNYGYEKAKASIDESLRRLQVEYIDLMLVHQPYCDYYGAYRALEEAYRAGKIRAIGVSNFQPDRFIDLASNVDVVPAINQLEMHVFCQQEQANVYLKEQGTQLMSWGPLAEGRNGIFDNPILTEVGKAHGKTVAQVALRYLIEMGAVIIPKSARIERMKENFEIFDFSLSKAETEQIKTLDLKRSLFYDHHDAETVKMFMGWR